MPDRPPVPLPPPDQLLATPAGRGARLLCRHLVTEARAAVDALDAEGADGARARHQVRVALRKLRVTLDAFDHLLRDTVPAKAARRAQALARRLSPARTHDALRHLLDDVATARTPTQRAALARLDLAAALRLDVPVDAALIRQRFTRLERLVLDSTDHWTEQHRVDDPAPTATFADAAADALDHAADRMARRFAAVRTDDDVAGQHAARLAAKAVRYLLAPLAECVADGPAMLRVLRDVQDHLGAMRDGHALQAVLHHVMAAAPEAPPLSRSLRSALEATDRDLTARHVTHTLALHPWRDTSSRTAFVHRLHAIATAWRTMVTPPMEIERKWLLSALPPHARHVTPALLRQGYLPGEALVERIRSVTDVEGTTWVRTVKLGRGRARIEVEEPTTAALGASLYALTAGQRVEKRRYAVTEGALTWEVDEFTDRALVLAEVELPTEDTAAELPAWLAPYVVREVTGERAFTNWQLAR